MKNPIAKISIFIFMSFMTPYASYAWNDGYSGYDYNPGYGDYGNSYQTQNFNRNPSSIDSSNSPWYSEYRNDSFFYDDYDYPPGF